jgi:hypothetical protein
MMMRPIFIVSLLITPILIKTGDESVAGDDHFYSSVSNFLKYRIDVK